MTGNFPIGFSRIYVRLVAMALTLLLGGCITVSKEDYRSNLIWTPLPASERIDATVWIETACSLTPEVETVWKRFGNSDASLANYNQATCDAISEDMAGSRLFQRVTASAAGKSDLLVKVASIEGKAQITLELAVFNPASMELLGRYGGVGSLPSFTHAEREKEIPRVLANLREQLLDDYRNDGEIAQLVKAKTSARATAKTDRAPIPAAAAEVSGLMAGLTAKSPPRPNAYAVVVGIEHYRQKLPTADYATADAQAVTTYLTRVLGYPEENVVTLLNDRATNVDLVKYFEKWLPNHIEEGGSVFVYFSGHGAPNPRTGDAFLVPFDGDPAFIDETGYSLKRMYAALGKLPAKSITVALDSCFSGAGGRSVIAQGTRSISMNLKDQAPIARNMTVLAASSGEQTSSTYVEKGHGLFTYYLLQGIKDEEVVAADGSLRLDDLFAYLQPQVERVARREYNNEQTPQWLGKVGH